jgi:hypothetical protein
VAMLAGGQPAAAQGACDRTCLEGFLNRYLDALAAHDPSRLPVAPDVKFVENDQMLKLGQGTWGTVDGLGAYRHYFADPQMGEAVVITTVREHGVPAIMDIRLRIEDGRIREAETQVSRDPAGAQRYEKMGQPEAVWLEPVPPEKRVSRATMVASVDKYFSGMQRNDPKGDYSFFDKDCDRLEHAEHTTNLKTPQTYGHSTDTAFSSLGCEAQFQTGFLGFVTKIRDRRYVVVDEERQEVFAFMPFDHNGTVRTLPSVNGKSSPIPPYFDAPRTLQVGEAFRLRGDKLYRIEMTLIELPYGSKPALAFTN